MTDDVQVRGSWPLTIEDATHGLLWHVAGTNPPQYAPDERMTRLHMEAQQRLKASISVTIVTENGIIPFRKPNNGGYYAKVIKDNRAAVLVESQENQLMLDLDGIEA